MKQASKKSHAPAAPKDFRMFLIPCSCGVSFAVADGYDHKGMHLRSFTPAPIAANVTIHEIDCCGSITKRNSSGKWVAAKGKIEACWVFIKRA